MSSTPGPVLRRASGSLQFPKLAERFAVAERAMAGREPVATFPAPEGPFLQPKFELNFDFHNTLAFNEEAPERGANQIRIYDLTDPPLR